MLCRHVYVRVAIQNYAIIPIHYLIVIALSNAFVIIVMIIYFDLSMKIRLTSHRPKMNVC